MCFISLRCCSSFQDSLLLLNFPLFATYNWLFGREKKINLKYRFMYFMKLIRFSLKFFPLLFISVFRSLFVCFTIASVSNSHLKYWTDNGIDCYWVQQFTFLLNFHSSTYISYYWSFMCWSCDNDNNFWNEMYTVCIFSLASFPETGDLLLRGWLVAHHISLIYRILWSRQVELD